MKTRKNLNTASVWNVVAAIVFGAAAAGCSFQATWTLGADNTSDRRVDSGVGDLDGGVAPSNDAGAPAPDASPPGDAGSDAAADAAPPDDAGDASVSAACRLAVPAPPDATVVAGDARGSMVIGAADHHPVEWKHAVYVAVPGSSYVQVIVSDDPALCSTLQHTNASATCSIDGAHAESAPGYAYLTASFPTPVRSESSVREMTFTSNESSRFNAVQWGGVFTLDDDVSSAHEAPMRGQFYVCDGTHDVAGSGVLSATFCPGAQPICY